MTRFKRHDLGALSTTGRPNQFGSPLRYRLYDFHQHSGAPTVEHVQPSVLPPKLLLILLQALNAVLRD